ncbi:MAG TPA: glutathione peroxidase [Gemmata sp.]|nr:glutathione peroxidase [Gemmata sp.]
MKGIDGNEMELSKFRGKVVLIVNVASNCGYTPQYKGLQDLYTKYEKDGFVILGIPANDFGMQEPGSEKEIQEFCTSKYMVTFPMTSKEVVKGANKTELYKMLTATTLDKNGKVIEVSWNFEKFLIGRNGKVAGRFVPKIKPEELTKAIKTELDKPAK